MRGLAFPEIHHVLLQDPEQTAIKERRLSSRFGFDADKSLPLEENIQWAAENGFEYIDFQADLEPNSIASFDDARVDRIRSLCETTGVRLGIHPSSAINHAEIVPIVAEAVEEYMEANVALAERLGCGWFVAHGGYHFGDIEKRRPVVVDRIRRLIERTARAGMEVYFENHNREPELSEMHYLPHNVAETRWFLDEIEAPNFKWAFNVAHGNLVPEGWAGFLEAFGAGNIGQVRVNDNNGDYEIHLVPGEGNIDFEALFTDLRNRGYQGWFNLGFGTFDDKARIRDRFEHLL